MGGAAEEFDWNKLAGPQVNPDEFDWSRLGPQYPPIDPQDFGWSEAGAEPGHFAIARGVLLEGGDLADVRRELLELDIRSAIVDRIVEVLALERITGLVYTEAPASKVLERLSALGLDAAESAAIHQKAKKMREIRLRAHLGNVRLMRFPSRAPLLVQQILKLLGLA